MDLFGSSSIVCYVAAVAIVVRNRSMVTLITDSSAASLKKLFPGSGPVSENIVFTVRLTRNSFFQELGEVCIYIYGSVW